MADSNEKLFSDFAPVTTQEWLDKITVDLKGADFEKKLVWKTNEGFKVKPFYRREDLEGLKTTDALPGTFPYLRGTRKNDNTWYIRQEICVDDPAEANGKALDILQKGVDSIGFHFMKSQITEDMVNRLLQDIHPECIELNFYLPASDAVEGANVLVAYFKNRGCKCDAMHGSIHYDPLGELLTIGKETAPDFGVQGKKLIEIVSPLPLYQCIDVDAYLLADAGAYISQELGYALAWGNEYLQLLTEAGVKIDEVADRIRFNFGISPNYFMEIAKFRAARMLWADIVKQYQPAKEEACKMHTHAQTSTFNLTIYDAHVNLLRSQTEAMSAALAGVDSITVTPFDRTYEKPDEFAERIARNQQLLLKEECHLDKVVDPAGGSYYIENLTVSIAKQAWDIFLKVEAEGGFYECIKKGTVQEAVNNSGKARREAVSKRKEILLGTNQYPNFNEKAADKITCPLPTQCTQEEGTDYPILKFNRAASEFEALRLQTEHSGKRPKAFMLTIGNLAMRQARAQFSCNFLACAGYEVIDNLGFATVEEGVEAALRAKADIVVICSSDDEYAEYAIPAYKALHGRAMFIVAGAPACMDQLKEAGIENFIHVRVNVLETLKEYNKKLLG